LNFKILRKGILFLFLLCFATAGWADAPGPDVSEGSQSGEELKTAVINVTVRPPDIPALRKDPFQTLVSFEFVRAQPVEVFHALSTKTGINVIITGGSDVDTLTMRVTDMPFLDALRLVCNSLGLYFVIKDDTVVVSDNRYGETDEITRVVQTNFVPLPDLKALAEAYREVKYTINLASGQITLRGPRSRVDDLMRVITENDHALPQIEIEARIVQLENTDLDDIGWKWDFGTWEFSMRDEPLGTDEGIYRFGRLNWKTWDFSAVMSMLKQKGKVKVLSTPRIVVKSLNGGALLSGQDVPIITSTSDGGKVEKEHVGIDLVVTPRVHADGTITLAVNTVVATINGWVETVQLKAPIVTRRKAETIVRLHNNQILAIGGLIHDEDIESWVKVPLLGDIPILKKLFTYRNVSKKHNTVLVFIRPKIIDPDHPFTMETDINVMEELIRTHGRIQGALSYGELVEKNVNISPENRVRLKKRFSLVWDMPCVNMGAVNDILTRDYYGARAILETSSAADLLGVAWEPGRTTLESLTAKAMGKLDPGARTGLATLTFYYSLPVAFTLLDTLDDMGTAINLPQAISMVNQLASQGVDASDIYEVIKMVRLDTGAGVNTRLMDTLSALF